MYLKILVLNVPLDKYCTLLSICHKWLALIHISVSAASPNETTCILVVESVMMREMQALYDQVVVLIMKVINIVCS